MDKVSKNTVFDSLPNSFNLAEYLLLRNEKNKRKTAFVSKHSKHTYGEIASLVKKGASYFHSKNIAIGERIAFFSEDSIGFIIAFLSAVGAGLVPVLINPASDFEVVLDILADCDPAHFLISTQLKMRLFDNQEIPLAHEEMDLFPTFLESFTNDGVVFHQAGKKDLAFIAYTSGSTGKPKGVMHMHYSPIVACRNYAESTLGLKETDKILSGPPLAFTYGLGTSLYMPMYLGATCILSSDKGAFGLLKAINLFKPTVLFGVPSHYGAMLSVLDISPINVESLRLCVSAGEKLPRRSWEKWHEKVGPEICEGVGTTESTHIFLSNSPSECVANSVGKVVPGYDVSFADNSRDELKKIILKGEGLMMGYWNNPKETELSLIDGGLVFKDMYYKDSTGNFYIAGRDDQLVKLHGMWLLPSDIEEKTLELPGVRQVAVCVVQSLLIEGVSDLLLFVEFEGREEGLEKSVRLVRAHLKRTLPKNKVPKLIQPVSSFRMTPTGKIDRRKMMTEYMAEKESVCVKSNLDEVAPIPGREGNFKILISPKMCPSAKGVMGASSLMPGDVVTNHVHDYSDEMFYVESGSGHLVVDGEPFHFRKGDAVYVPKGKEHKVVNSGDSELKVVFWVSPLAPKPELGHREIIEKEMVNG